MKSYAQTELGVGGQKTCTVVAVQTVVALMALLCASCLSLSLHVFACMQRYSVCYIANHCIFLILMPNFVICTIQLTNAYITKSSFVKKKATIEFLSRRWDNFFQAYQTLHNWMEDRDACLTGINPLANDLVLIQKAVETIKVTCINDQQLGFY